MDPGPPFFKDAGVNTSLGFYKVYVPCYKVTFINIFYSFMPHISQEAARMYGESDYIQPQFLPYSFQNTVGEN